MSLGGPNVLERVRDGIAPASFPRFHHAFFTLTIRAWSLLAASTPLSVEKTMRCAKVAARAS